jgi:hypothetical protein
MKEYYLTLQYDGFEAKLRLTGEWSLYDLAEFLIKTLGFDFDHCFEFCDNLKNPYKSKIRYTLFADIGEDADDPGVRNTLVSAVFKAKTKMLFHFDYGDDWYFLVSCTEIKDSTSKSKSRKVLATAGDPPEQYPDYEDE